MAIIFVIIGVSNFLAATISHGCFAILGEASWFSLHGKPSSRIRWEIRQVRGKGTPADLECGGSCFGTPCLQKLRSVQQVFASSAGDDPALTHRHLDGNVPPG